MAAKYVHQFRYLILPTEIQNLNNVNDLPVKQGPGLKTVAFSSSQLTQQTLPGYILPTGPALLQHLVHPYSQPTLPLGPFAKMIGYHFLHQSYTNVLSGFQKTFAFASVTGRSFRPLLQVMDLFGNSTVIPENYQVNEPAGPAGSTISYDDVLANHYR
ncbi:hypothetical protein CTI12_AA181060 [Artemisia annua]|uniref:Uncharacterized protein n=1 Tax=Artemisia annua TaxID=35608 RepID=A0A2U1P7C0_ARTAN|nr:hypothetical protein CTI12_AA181060 [Artemisia annua]